MERRGQNLTLQQQQHLQLLNSLPPPPPSSQQTPSHYPVTPETAPVNSEPSQPPPSNLTLPKGWKREENIRQSGLSAGRVDVYYISPDGKKFWTKPQLARYFGDTVDLANFDFHSGKFVSPLPGGSATKRSRVTSSSLEYTNPMKTDASLLPPIRQTASIFKQPVTVVKTQKSRVKMDFKHGVQDSPRQLFWEKRLQGLRASDPSGSILAPSDLPPGIVAAGPHIDADTVLHSIATALHLASHPITGQSGDRMSIEQNPAVFINPDQPLIHEIAVNEDDIRAQEEKVSLARKKLEEALLMFYPGSITRTDRESVTEIPEDDPGQINIKGQEGSRGISGPVDMDATGSGSIRSPGNPQKKLKLSQAQPLSLPHQAYAQAQNYQRH